MNTEELINEIFKKHNGISFAEFESKTHEYPLDEVKPIQEEILKARDNKVKITVVGDYDVDGQTSTAIAILGLTELGCEFTTRLPKRFSEGYGLSEKIVDEIDEGIILTFDNGIVANEAVKKAKEKGLKVIITDHHEPQMDVGIPEADIILDPHLLKANDPDWKGFEDYCGAGIAYKLFRDIVKPETAEKMLHLAAIATIADVVPLYGENRFIVKEGFSSLIANLLKISKNGRGNITKGLYLLLKEVSLDHYLEEDDVGFRIAPILNAPGRLKDDGATLSTALLAEDKDENRAVSLAQELIQCNEERKLLTKKALKEAEDYIAENAMFNDCPLVLYQPDTPEGLLGLVAGNLSEKYKVPCIVLSDSVEDGILKGSGRSNGDLNLFDMINEYNDLLLKFGGHKDACGLSLNKDNLKTFLQAITEEYEDYERPTRAIEYDAEINASLVPEVHDILQKMKPFGNGNPNYVFKIKDFRAVPKGNSYYNILGENKATISLNGDGFKIIGFNLAEDYIKEGFPNKMNLIGYVQNSYYFNSYQKRMTYGTQVQFTDFEKISEPQKMSLLQQKLQERSKSAS